MPALVVSLVDIYVSPPPSMLTTKNVHLHHGGDVVSQRAFIVWGTFANHNTDLATQDV